MKKLPVYHIADFEDHRSFFYANELPAHIREHGFIAHPHRHGFYLTVLFSQGSGTHEIDFHTYPVSPGTVFFLTPGQVHRWSLSEDADGYIFFHTAEWYNSIYVQKRIDDYPFFSALHTQPLCIPSVNVAPFFRNILLEYRSGSYPHTADALVAYTDLLYLQLAREYVPAAAPGSSASALYLHKFQELLRHIDRHYATLHSPKDYAGLLHVSTRHLNRMCMETIKKTTGDLIAERILLEARRLLVHTAKAVKEIAADLGFDDPSYFIRFFKKQSGESPAAFRKRQLLS